MTARDHEAATATPFHPAALAERRRIMTFVLCLGVALMVLKAAAFWVTGSRALLSDALESVVNVVTGGFGLFSVWLAGRPPDETHPYGHGKVEFFAAGLQGTMILLAAIGIVRESIPMFLDPKPIPAIETGLLLAGIAGVINGVVGAFLIRRGRRVHSATLAGEGHHLLTDTITTAGVAVGLVLVRVTGNTIFDPIAACLVALSIGWSGIVLLREAGSRLMDSSDDELLAGISRALECAPRRPEWIEIHLMRAWRSGEFVHIDFHLTFPRTWSMSSVHASQLEMLQLLIRTLGRPGDVMIHPDPCTPALCASCQVTTCRERSAAFVRAQSFELDKLTAGPAGLEVDTCQTVQAAVSRDTTREAMTRS